MTSSMPPVHPAAELFPMMSDDELAALAADIKANGLQQPVVLYGAQLLDGRNRWRACEIAGVDVKTKDWAGKDAVSYVRSLNLHRRHLTAAQRAALAVKAEPVYAEAAEKRKTDGNKKGAESKNSGRSRAETTRNRNDDAGRALAQAAKETGASLDSAKQMKQVAKAAPEVVELVQRGQVETVAEAKRVAALPVDTRAEVVDLVKAGIDTSTAIETVSSPLSLAEKARALFESVIKKTSSLSTACLLLVEFMEKNEMSIAGPEVAIVKAKAYQARAALTDIINLIEKGRTNV